ncbi:MAG: NUDIX domain-containing protein [Anaerolineales bacterium]|nr:NUDIX domain-containing protein [Anaerolineales bacterium]
MKIGTSGVLVNGLGYVLLMQRDDTRTFAAPGGGLERGELPTDGIVREIQEETGVLAMPVRLVAVTYWRQPPNGHLFLIFRCLQRGGEPQRTDEAISVGYYPTNTLPRLMARMHRERLEVALNHQGEGPTWLEHQTGWKERLGWAAMQRIIYPIKNWQLRREGLEPPTPAPGWQTGAFVVIRNELGQVLWVKRTDKDVWNLPGGGSEEMETPWETAVREAHEETGLTVKLDKLAVINVYHGEAGMVFTFTAHPTGGTLTTGPEAADFAYFTPGAEPTNSMPQHVERVADALNGGETAFRLQEQ